MFFLALSGPLLGGLASPAHAETLCSDAGPDIPVPGSFFAAFNVTSEGSSDGTVGIDLPEGGNGYQYEVVSRLHFEGSDVSWTEGPFDAEPGSYIEWFLNVGVNNLTEERQFDYLSDLLVSIRLYREGYLVGETSAGYARVAFEPGVEPLVLLPDEARELAPGDAWNVDVDPRVEEVNISDVPRPVSPASDEGPHSEEVDG